MKNVQTKIYPRTVECVIENSNTEVPGPSEVDVDVRCPVLVPLLLCPPKGSLWGAVKA